MILVLMIHFNLKNKKNLLKIKKLKFKKNKDLVLNLKKILINKYNKEIL